MHFQNRSSRDEQKLEWTNELMKLVLLSNSPIRLSTPKYFSWGQDALWFSISAAPLPPLLSLEFSQTFCQALSPRSLPSFGAPWLPLYAMTARIDCSRAQLGLNKVAHCPKPLPICHALQVEFSAMSGMPMLIRETMTHVLKSKSEAHYANLINTMCIAQPEI